MKHETEGVKSPDSQRCHHLVISPLRVMHSFRYFPYIRCVICHANMRIAMQKIIVRNGLIAGAVVVLSFIAGTMMSSGSETHPFAELVGYLIMIIAMSVIFVGIKQYRDKELGGVIKFGTAFKLGMGITLVASLIYVVGWEINLSLTDYSFIDEYTAHVLEQKQADGLQGAAFEAEQARMEEMKENYSKFWFRLPVTFIEIFPVGLFVTLLASFLLKNNRFMAAA